MPGSPESAIARGKPRSTSARACSNQAGEVFYPTLRATRQMVETGEPAFQAVFGTVWEEHLRWDDQQVREILGVVRRAIPGHGACCWSRRWSRRPTSQAASSWTC